MMTILNVDGMTCSHCEQTVLNSVTAIKGVAGAVVNLKEKTVTISHNETVNYEMMKKQVEDLGYDVLGYTKEDVNHPQ